MVACLWYRLWHMGGGVQGTIQQGGGGPGMHVQAGSLRLYSHHC